ncbi:MAG: stage V sporulation protein AE [Oscillospiraceae bacterium]|nr:stage V sporulation protein AE [Oscillospiraceae bacterium]
MEYLRAFLIGGLICVVGQLLICYTKLTPARILVAFVVAGVVLGAFGVYDPLVRFAGAGATVPLIGFGNLIADGTKEALQQDKGFLGALSGGLAKTAAGVGASIFFGLVVALIFKPKSKT